jgi:hypothetical protein
MKAARDWQKILGSPAFWAAVVAGLSNIAVALLAK